MALAFYRFLMFCLSPVIWALLSYRLLKGKEDRERFNERKGIASQPRPDGALVWCHGASVGEVLSSLSVLIALREQLPSINLLLTTGTRTGHKMLQTHAPLIPGTGQTIVQYVPLDFPGTVARFFKHWQPTASVFLESDFWPNLLAAAPHPILLNGRVSDRSWPRYQRYSWFFKPLLSRFEHIQAQREEDALRLKAMGGKHVKVGGNIKFDAEPLPADDKQLEKLRAQLGRRPLLVAASTHAGEEELVAQLHLKLKTKAEDLLTIIVPRHPHRGTSAANAVMRYIKKGVARRGVGDLPILGGPKHTEVYIADTLGELGLWYRLADAAIIGGTLVKTGGHNPLEPLKLGTPTVTGPHMFNFKDMTPILTTKGLIALAPATATGNVVNYLAEALLPLLTDPNASLKQRSHISSTMPTLGGASQKAAAYLVHMLQKPVKKGRLNMFSLLLSPLGWLYGAGATLHGKVRAFHPYYPAVPTISVGNLTLGGTGKTLVVEWLATHFARQGKQVAILSRGYGGTIRQPVRVDPLMHTASEVGDEPLALATAFHGLPVHVWTGRNRAKLAQRAEAAGTTLLILDDGFQRQDVARQVNILTLDAARGFGNGRCLPAGPLREPLSARKRADFAVMIGEDTTTQNLPAWQGLPCYRLTVTTPLPASLQGKPLIAFAGLGRNSKFFGALTTSGAQLAATEGFPDHHHYTRTDLAHLQALAKQHHATLVTTPKDDPKLPAKFAKILNPMLVGEDQENILADITAKLA